MTTEEAPGTAVAETNATVALTAKRAGELATLEIGVAKARAKVAADVIEENKLYKIIGKGRGNPGKKYVFVDGWTTLARLYNYMPDIESTERLDDVQGYGYVAHARLMNEAGQVVSRAEASATTTEARWAGSDDYAIRSMAQTRAISKVCRVALSWVMVLAGFQGTPAEEMSEGPARSKRTTKTEESLKGRQEVLAGLVKDRTDNDGWDATAELMNATREGAMTQVDGKWSLRWDAISDQDSLAALIDVLTPPTDAEPAESTPTKEAPE